MTNVRPTSVLAWWLLVLLQVGAQVVGVEHDVGSTRALPDAYTLGRGNGQMDQLELER